ncbi:hypothetical protein NDU88_001001 [Pleurodeles waltl]|uniref:Uncharacterized protein n=1 Tax=Pleurodeles waltl TaxID=8319 RepID=A0AAV7S654_PLEWA|nr:hypothetical protein NDU88_001001 [Pleurodeles waltl]
MERILQEIATVGHRLEAMDFKITNLATDSKSICTDIASFQDSVTELDHRLTDVEGRLNALTDRKQELQFLQNKLTDLEGRSRKDKVRFFGIPERKEGTDIRPLLRDLLSELTGLVFSPTLEFQRAYRIGPPYKDASGKTRLIIVCYLRHKQVHQLLTTACAHCEYTYEGHEICMVVDFCQKLMRNGKHSRSSDLN